MGELLPMRRQTLHNQSYQQHCQKYMCYMYRMHGKTSRSTPRRFEHLAMITRMKGFQNLISTMVLKISKAITFASKKSFIKFDQREEMQNDAIFELTTHIFISLNSLSYVWYVKLYIQKLFMKVTLIVLRKGVRHIINVSRSPLKKQPTLKPTFKK